MDLVSSSIIQLSQLIHDRLISIEELTRAYIKQIEKVNPALNAIVQFYPERALKIAKQLDAQFFQHDEKSLLYGIPFTLKDIYDTKGDITTAGTLGLKEHVGKDDATIAKRLQLAGAILLGKTNTSELECAIETDNLVYGKTYNPYDLKRMAGGSSGGAAASVAACMSVFDVGADLGGSIRLPAHYCGIVGLRPTPFRIPSTGTIYGFRTGISSLFNTEGPLARCVEDVEIVLQQISGKDGYDPHVISAPFSGVCDKSLEQMRVAYFYEDGTCTVTAEKKSAIDNAVNVLMSSNVACKIDIPNNFQQGSELIIKLLNPTGKAPFNDAAQAFGTTKTSHLFNKLADFVEPYKCGAEQMLQRWNEWETYRQHIFSFFRHYDAFICPVTAREALLFDDSMMDNDTLNEVSFTWAVSLTLCPSIVVRAGTADNNMPIGIQIVAPPNREGILLVLAKKIEKSLGGWQKPTLEFI